MYIIVVFLFFMVNISMAEMASMAPTAGKVIHCLLPTLTEMEISEGPYTGPMLILF